MSPPVPFVPYYYEFSTCNIKIHETCLETKMVISLASSFTWLANPHSSSGRSDPNLKRLDRHSPLRISVISAKNQDFHPAKRRCDYYDLYNELIPYKDAWSWQKHMVATKQALLEADKDVCDSVVVLQHPPVYTLGTRSLEKFLHFDLHDSPIDIYRTERGGEVTYHGPGQMHWSCSS